MHPAQSQGVLAVSRSSTRSGPRTLIICACDQVYFPMVKGLLLSLLDPGRLSDDIGLAFIDVGCSRPSLEWMEGQGIRIGKLDPAVLGDLASAKLGYQRALACRPFLPKLFPEAETLIWIDSDTWVQDRSVFTYLRDAVPEYRQHLFIAPECHYSYTYVHDDVRARRKEMFSRYEPLFGAKTALQLSILPTLNGGFFAMNARNPIWTLWEEEIKRIFLHELAARELLADHRYHMADQIALNVVARRVNQLMLLDPLYNYLCLWTPPVRDAHGIVRVALPPHVPLGIIHLAGGWKWYGERYLRERLLYRGGDYLTPEERLELEALTYRAQLLRSQSSR